MGEEYGYDSSGRIVYIKSDDGEFVPFSGIQSVSLEDASVRDGGYASENFMGMTDVTESVLQLKLEDRSARKIQKHVARWVKHANRIHRHERRLKERIRRARLKGKPWVCLRDKDGGQICMSTSKHMGEHGWLTIRKNRKIIWDGEKSDGT